MKTVWNFLLLLIILFLWAAYSLVQWTTYLLNMWKLNLLFTWSLSWNLYPGANEVTGSIITCCTLVIFHSSFWILSRDTQSKVNHTHTVCSICKPSICNTVHTKQFQPKTDKQHNTFPIIALKFWVKYQPCTVMSLRCSSNHG